MNATENIRVYLLEALKFKRRTLDRDSPEAEAVNKFDRAIRDLKTGASEEAKDSDDTDSPD